jgi:hypothetical protein
MEVGIASARPDSNGRPKDSKLARVIQIKEQYKHGGLAQLILLGIQQIWTCITSEFDLSKTEAIQMR